MDYLHTEQLQFSIGDIVISVTPVDNIQVCIDPTYHGFFSSLEPEITIFAHNGSAPFMPTSGKMRYPNSIWEHSRSKGLHLFSCFHSDQDPKPYMSAVMDDDFRRGDIYIDTRDRTTYSANPLQYPLDELVIIGALSRGRGVMLHACGAILDEEGILFVGSSGKGKSTIANMLKDEKNAVILNDDRIIVRKCEDAFVIYGTPWYGEVKLCSNRRARLKRIFFIGHADQNSMVALPLIDTATELVANSFPPFWDREGMEFTLDFCGELAGYIPAYDLGFLPDKNLFAFINSSRTRRTQRQHIEDA